jgi:signal transduction histidine kinase
MQTLVIERDERAVHAASEALADRFAQRQVLLQVLANQLTDGLSLLRLLDDTPDLRQIFDGGLVATNAQGEVIGAWQPGRVWATNVQSTHNPAWILEHDTLPVLVIAYAKRSTGELTLFGGISLTSLNVPGTMRAMKNSLQTRILLVADDGHVLDDTTGSAIGQQWTPEANTAMSHAVPSLPMTENTSNSLVVSSPVKGLGWTLVFQEPWTEVISSDLKSSLVGPLAVIPAVLIAMGVLAFGTLTIVIPLRKLRRSTARLAWGDYGVIQESVGGAQEIRDLQTTLNQMAQRLSQAQAGMHSYIGAVIQGQEDERKRIARELHDDTLQSLIALNQQRQRVEQHIEREPVKAKEHLGQLSTILDELMSSLRRLIRDMRPTYIEDLGLVPALEMLGSQAGQMTPVEVTFKTTSVPRRLPLNHELSLYRIAQEAVTNAIRYAAAKGIQISLNFDPDILLTIADDGTGFVLPDRPSNFAQAGHYGLMGMVERAEQMGALFRIDSALGKGTTIEVRLPIEEPH